VNRWGGRSVPSLASQLRAVLLAVAVAAPWWAVNIKQVVGFAEGARGFVLHSLGRPGVATWMLWLDTVFQCLLGAGVSLLILLVAMAWFRKAIVKNETTLGPLQKATLRLCACAGLPIVLTQLSGTNHLLRHITPAVIPLAVGVGVLANNSGWDRSKATLAISGVLLGGQLLMFAAPVWFPSDGPVANGFVNCRLPWRVMSRRDQWDWNPLRDLAQSCGLRAPRIAYMGLGPGLSPPQLAYPWAVQGAATRSATIDWPVVEWLWRFGDGPVDWQKVMDQVERSDIVLTLPHYPGVEEEDKLCNEHNDEFVSRLSADPHLQGPIRLQVGRFTPVEVAVFLRKGLVYDFARGASPKSQETNRKLRKDK
jgi:hypothetical protein